MRPVLQFPFYIKSSIFLIGLYVFTCILIEAQDIILPLIYSVIIAILIYPLVDFLERKKVNRTLAIAGVLTITLLILIGGIVLITSQISKLSESWPELASKFKALFREGVTWVAGSFNVSVPKIDAWITNVKSDMVSNSGAAIGVTLATMGGVLATIFLVPVYTFMLLFYAPHLHEFSHKVFGIGNREKVNELLGETKIIIQSYLVGLFIEFAIIAVLNSLGLLVLGIEYALLLGVIGALLNVIPYLGGIMAVFLFMAIAMVTKSPDYVLYVVILYSIIQLVDNNFIVPKIIGSKVKLNALISILAVITGAAIWGIPGMFLSIPLLAVVKLIFDRVDPLKPWGFLLGDTTPSIFRKRVTNSKQT